MNPPELRRHSRGSRRPARAAIPHNPLMHQWLVCSLGLGFGFASPLALLDTPDKVRPRDCCPENAVNPRCAIRCELAAAASPGKTPVSCPTALTCRCLIDDIVQPLPRSSPEPLRSSQSGPSSTPTLIAIDHVLRRPVLDRRHHGKSRGTKRTQGERTLFCCPFL